VTEQLSAEELARVPVFPLARLVLFPDTLLPLHFFEPRYRALMRDCLEKGQKCIAVAQLRPGFDAAGKPPIYERASIGRILQHIKNADGTYDVVLQGVARVMLDEQATEDPYRVARAHVLTERVPAGGIKQGELAAVMALAESVRDMVRRSQPEFELLAKASDSPARIADKLADQLVTDPALRQELLETLDVQKRLDALAREVATLESLLRRRFNKASTGN